MSPENGRPPRLSLQDLTDEEAIFQAVRNQCIQSPFTILPLALAAGMLLLTGAFSWGFFGVFAAVVLGVVGVAAFVFNLWIRGETLARRHVKGLMERMKNERQAALSDVENMCASIGLGEAAKEARELGEAIALYTGFLETRAGATLGDAVGQRLELVESARAAGVAHLRRAAEIHMALRGIDMAQLRAEVTEWEAALHSPSAHRSVLESKLFAHAQQIERYGKLSGVRDELIARSNELEAAIKNAYLSDAGRSDLTRDGEIDNPAHRLSRVISAAEVAEAELREFLHETSSLSHEST
ncbi:hypothetical protein HNR46_003465 [Haloferula luteola]|uniref:Uncharacterized protein n=1 Tax=Haloferula luteola TaxID=595692 RepID=A0A840VH96_9BACT|nr:hypothetical protein [Haloferula luteola]MBB5353210.1 hypothetical protein [Haloferula luteola]